MPIFGVLVGWFIGGIGMAMTSLIGRALVALGVGYVVYSGSGVVTDWLYSQMQSSIGMMPSYIVDFLGWLWLDKAISMIFSAWTAALALMVGTGGSITKMRVKGS